MKQSCSESIYRLGIKKPEVYVHEDAIDYNKKKNTQQVILHRKRFRRPNLANLNNLTEYD